MTPTDTSNMTEEELRSMYIRLQIEEIILEMMILEKEIKAL